MYLRTETKSLWSHDSIQLHTFRELCLIKDKSTSNMREKFIVIEKQSAVQDYLVPNKRTISDNHSDNNVEWSGSDLTEWTNHSSLTPHPPMTGENHENLPNLYPGWELN
jgi:hypothetical protein